MYPKYTQSATKGEKGVRIVDQIISDNYGWIFRRTHQEHDFGIDGYIDIVSLEGEVYGLSIAVQIKHGKSYFKNKGKFGYKYIGEKKHLNYLINHPIPVMIIICSSSNKCYWEMFSVEKTQKYGANWSLDIPIKNKLNINAKERISSIFSKKTDHTPELEHYWLVNNIIQKFDSIKHIISKEDIVNNDITGLISFFNRFRVTNDLFYKSEGIIDISVCGYNSDSRELWQIQEVRDYFKVAEPIINDWFYLLDKSKGSEGIRLLCLCLVENTVDENNIVHFNPDQLDNFIATNIQKLKVICTRLAYTDEEYIKLENSVIENLENK